MLGSSTLFARPYGSSARLHPHRRERQRRAKEQQGDSHDAKSEPAHCELIDVAVRPQQLLAPLRVLRLNAFPDDPMRLVGPSPLAPEPRTEPGGQAAEGFAFRAASTSVAHR